MGVRGRVKDGCGASGMSSRVHGPAIHCSGGNWSAWGLVAGHGGAGDGAQDLCLRDW